MKRLNWILSSLFIMVLLYLPGWATVATQQQVSLITDPAPSQATGTPATVQNNMIKGYVRTLEGKYLLSPGDTMTLSVYGAPEFDEPSLVIRPDGFITMKPFGEMDVAGMDVDGLTQTMEGKLRQYLKDPKVSLTVTKFHPAIVYVLGAVEKPGAYEIHGNIDNPDSSSSLLARGQLTVSNLIANAGGISQDADPSQISIKNNEKNESRSVNLIQFLRDGDVSQDIIVHSGDTIMVPQLAGGHAQMDDATYKLLSQSALSPGDITVRVLGKVNTPGVYNLDSQSPGINSAIASAKGYLLEAREHKVKVLRMGPQGALTEIAVQPKQSDFALRNNDVVIVDERRIPIAGRGLDYTARLITPFLTFGNFANAVMDLVDPGRRFPINGNR
jgi:protein involved in polysaccharide export with SLBB domain